MTVLIAYVAGHLGSAVLTEAKQECLRRGESALVVNSSRGDALVDQHRIGHDEIEALTKDFEEAGIDLRVELPGDGRSADDNVVRVSEANDVSVIVIGVRKRSRTGKLLFGSTAQGIILDATCPVLCVKTD